MFVCCIPTCRNRVSSGLSFHRFSKHPEKKNKWIASIRIGLNDPNWNPSLDARVCSDHFSDEDFNTIGPNFKRKTLKEIAIPCFIKGRGGVVNQTNMKSLTSQLPSKEACNHIQNGVNVNQESAEESSPSRQQLQEACNHIQNGVDVNQTSAEESSPSRLQLQIASGSSFIPRKEFEMSRLPFPCSQKGFVALDHKYSTTPALLITKYKKAQMRLMEANMKYKNSVKRELRLSKKYNLLLEKVEELKSLNQELTDKLTRFDNKFLDLFTTERKFNLDQKLFATTLHMYSPKAYDFLRSNGLHLPHSRTLRKFRSSLRMQIDHENNDNNDDDNDGNDDNNDGNNDGNDDSDEMLQEPA